jgi:hypothetical protein
MRVGNLTCGYPRAISGPYNDDGYIGGTEFAKTDIEWHLGPRAKHFHIDNAVLARPQIIDNLLPNVFETLRH